jgi:hypothetical protein
MCLRVHSNVIALCPCVFCVCLSLSPTSCSHLIFTFLTSNKQAKTDIFACLGQNVYLRVCADIFRMVPKLLL